MSENARRRPAGWPCQFFRTLDWSYRLGLAAAVLVGLLSGCSGGRELAEVEGIISLEGQPLNNVEVVFMPDPERGTKGPRASAYTDNQGHFRLYADKAGKEGAVPGFHRVCIIDSAAVTTPANLSGRQLGGLAQFEIEQANKRGTRVPLFYYNPSQTPLPAEVKSGRQTLNFDLPSGFRK